MVKRVSVRLEGTVALCGCLHTMSAFRCSLWSHADI